MYEPADGDHITVTRTLPDGRAVTFTGRVSDYIPADDPGYGAGGFRLTGTGPDGTPVDSYFGGCAAMAKYHGITQTTQTIQPATPATA